MEILIPTNLQKIPHSISNPYSPTFIFSSNFFPGLKFRRRWKSNSRTLRFTFCSQKLSLPEGDSFVGNREESHNEWQGSDLVEVIGIGSRRDAILDFCLESPVLQPSLRFWNIITKDLSKLQLQQRFIGQDGVQGVVEVPWIFKSCSKAVILVATAAYGSDHIKAFDILESAKSANGLVFCIIVKPFKFEGRRRQDEVKDLLSKIEEHSNFYIVVDTDVLLEKDPVTLDEALKSANTAVLMAINTLSILISESQKKLLDLPGNDVKELKLPELNEILESYKGARIGFGSGYNIQTSIMRAVYDCPFLSDGIEDINGIVICIITSSDVADVSNVDAFLRTLRIITNYNGKVVLSVVHESNLESNLIRTTIITAGYAKEQVPQEKSIFSRLVHHFPFISNLLRRHIPQSSVSQDSYVPESSSFSLVADTLDPPDEISEGSPTDVTSEDFGIYSAELESILSSNDDEVHDSRGYDSGSDQRKVDRSETISDSLNYNDPDTEGLPAIQSESLSRHKFREEYWISKYTNDATKDGEANTILDTVCAYKLPVGVKQPEEFKNSPTITNVIQHEENIVTNDVRARIPLARRMSLDAPDDVGLGISSEFNDGASAKWKGNDNNVSKKQGVLSARAASMLESERASQKKWNPIVEMNYRGGVYKGRCQGGLPEGKGRLLLSDGSIYEGLWRYGKRSGLGTFHFSNGDVFQGLWRDDVMHGKGWLYFHSGDRWFANFWKGKANGEGRFYSSRGDIFFGHFKDGWRCGHFLCINVDGTRYLEHWDEGVLLSRKQLEAEDNSSA